MGKTQHHHRHRLQQPPPRPPAAVATGVCDDAGFFPHWKFYGRNLSTILLTTFVSSCDCERHLRHDAENCKSQLLSKLEFDADVHHQRVSDLEQRLCNQQRIVEELSEQLKSSTTSDGKDMMTNLINRLREQMAAEFDKYRYVAAWRSGNVFGLDQRG